VLRRSGDRRWRPRRSSRPQRAAASASSGSGSGAGSVRGRLGPRRCAAWRRCRRTPGRRAAAAEGPRSPPPTSPRPCSGRTSGAARRPVRPRRTPASDADGDRRSAPSNRSWREGRRPGLGGEDALQLEDGCSGCRAQFHPAASIAFGDDLGPSSRIGPNLLGTWTSRACHGATGSGRLPLKQAAPVAAASQFEPTVVARYDPCAVPGSSRWRIL
jgi:hypothetical protein